MYLSDNILQGHMADINQQTGFRSSLTVEDASAARVGRSALFPRSMPVWGTLRTPSSATRVARSSMS